MTVFIAILLSCVAVVAVSLTAVFVIGAFALVRDLLQS